LYLNQLVIIQRRPDSSVTSTHLMYSKMYS
jgi:hypothetical protein